MRGPNCCLCASLFLVLFALEARSQSRVLWTRNYGECCYEFGNAIRQTTDGGYIITGSTTSFSGADDVWLVKLDSAGNEQWNRAFGGLTIDIGYSVQQTSDGGYVIAGQTYSFGSGNSDAWLIKTDQSGNAVVNKTFGGNNFDFASSIQQTSDGGYVFTGSTASFGPGKTNVWLIKTDPQGDTVWTRTIAKGLFNAGYSVQQTTDGGYIVTGYTYSGSRNDDVWLIKTDPSGNTVWTKTFGGRGLDEGRSVQQTYDGGYVISGTTESFGSGKTDVWLIKTDSSGNELWNKTFGGTGSDASRSVVQTKDGGYLITGWTALENSFSDLWIIRTNPHGEATWTKTMGGSSWEEGWEGQQTSDGGYIVAGTAYHNSTADVWVIRLGPEVRPAGLAGSLNTGDVVERSTAIPAATALLDNYPDPFNPETTIRYTLSEDAHVTLKVYSMLGQLVTTLVDELQTAGYRSAIWNGRNDSRAGVASGIYIYRITAGNFTATKRMLLLK